MSCIPFYFQKVSQRDREEACRQRMERDDDMQAALHAASAAVGGKPGQAADDGKKQGKDDASSIPHGRPI